MATRCCLNRARTAWRMIATAPSAGRVSRHRTGRYCSKDGRRLRPRLHHRAAQADRPLRQEGARGSRHLLLRPCALQPARRACKRLCAYARASNRRRRVARAGVCARNPSASARRKSPQAAARSWATWRGSFRTSPFCRVSGVECTARLRTWPGGRSPLLAGGARGGWRAWTRVADARA